MGVVRREKKLEVSNRTWNRLRIKGMKVQYFLCCLWNITCTRCTNLLFSEDTFVSFDVACFHYIYKCISIYFLEERNGTVVDDNEFSTVINYVHSALRKHFIRSQWIANCTILHASFHCKFSFLVLFSSHNDRQRNSNCHCHHHWRSVSIVTIYFN